MAEDRSDPEQAPRAADTGPRALHLIGIQRARSWGGSRVKRDESGAGLRVRYRDLEALARAVVYQMPELNHGLVQDHQLAVEAASRRGTILPAPFGVIFHGRRPLIRMLQDQYLVLDEALSFLDGQIEMRVHILTSDSNEPNEELMHAANQIYSDLRRTARAAVPFPNAGRRLLSSAFLVEKTGWVEFIQRAENLAAPHSEISLDITGPWPPYDFVRFVA